MQVGLWAASRRQKNAYNYELVMERRRPLLSSKLYDVYGLGISADAIEDIYPETDNQIGLLLQTEQRAGLWVADDWWELPDGFSCLTGTPSPRDDGQRASTGTPTDTTNQIETKVRALMGQVLRIDLSSVSSTSSFARLGGDSLLALHLVARARTTGVPGISVLLGDTSIAELVQGVLATAATEAAEAEPESRNSPTKRRPARRPRLRSPESPESPEASEAKYVQYTIALTSPQRIVFVHYPFGPGYFNQSVSVSIQSEKSTADPHAVRHLRASFQPGRKGTTRYARASGGDNHLLPKEMVSSGTGKVLSQTMWPALCGSAPKYSSSTATRSTLRGLPSRRTRASIPALAPCSKSHGMDTPSPLGAGHQLHRQTAGTQRLIIDISAQLGIPGDYQSHAAHGLDLARLQTACETVIRHHPALRTAFVQLPDMANPIQVVLRDGCADSVLRVTPNNAFRPGEPRPAAKTAHLELRINHASFDGSSSALLLRDIVTAYTGKLLDPSSASAAHGYFKSPVKAQAEVQIAHAFWAQHLEDVEPCRLPPLGSDPGSGSGLGSGSGTGSGSGSGTSHLGDTDSAIGSFDNSLSFKSGKELSLFSWCRRFGATTAVAIHAAWAVALDAYCYTSSTGAHDVCFG
ncbi:Nonribosomal peptide synthetase 8 [Colletotrichum tanaceti]|uniref:Nonribosomal peptide synthetase 8 n=1 Tax=Colletotrichum tanaceti TaxID=1306861 RepID=A0A4U6XDU5_9PEZI|nr:Nonribosomal peptide synthetase 8 [Colletotrichum tanaceti]